MKSFNSIDEKGNTNSAVTDFLDSLDTDMNSSIDLGVIKDENSDVPQLSNENIEENTEEVTALVELKPHSLLVAQTMFKKSIKISIKSFLISLSLGFLNLFF